MKTNDRTAVRQKRFYPFLAGLALISLLPGLIFVAVEYGRCKAGEIFVNGFGMALAFIPAGEFRMGKWDDEARAAGGEVAHEVRITKAFYMGTMDVTVRQFSALMKYVPERRRGSDIPVDVTWDEATEFCRRLSTQEGRKYRLPTEAEWEYACRAGTKGPYGGTGVLDDMGKMPNGLGLYDMNGTTFEWCADWYDDGAYYEKAAPGDPFWYAPPKKGITADPRGPSQGVEKVLRGGSANEDYPCLARYHGEPVETFRFRVVLEIE